MTLGLDESGMNDNMVWNCSQLKTLLRVQRLLWMNIVLLPGGKACWKHDFPLSAICMKYASTVWDDWRLKEPSTRRLGETEENHDYS